MIEGRDRLMRYMMRYLPLRKTMIMQRYHRQEKAE